MELVIRAGDEVGCAVVQELTLIAPLILPSTGGTPIQVVVGADDESGLRTVAVYARDAQSDAPWVLHAQGMLGTSDTGSVSPTLDMSVWPPTGAVAVDVGDAYEQLAGRGYEYGPAFQGCKPCGDAGAEVFAEVAVTDDSGTGVNGFGIHPALLDAALHALGISSETIQLLTTGATQIALPFSWEGVSLHAAGAERVRVTARTHQRWRGVARTGRYRRAASVVGALASDTSGHHRTVNRGNNSRRRSQSRLAGSDMVTNHTGKHQL